MRDLKVWSRQSKLKNQQQGYLRYYFQMLFFHFQNFMLLLFQSLKLSIEEYLLRMINSQIELPWKNSFQH